MSEQRNSTHSSALPPCAEVKRMAPVSIKDAQQHKYSRSPLCQHRQGAFLSPDTQKAEQLHNLSLDSPLTFIQSANTSLTARAQMISTQKR